MQFGIQHQHALTTPLPRASRLSERDTYNDPGASTCRRVNNAECNAPPIGGSATGPTTNHPSTRLRLAQGRHLTSPPLRRRSRTLPHDQLWPEDTPENGSWCAADSGKQNVE